MSRRRTIDFFISNDRHHRDMFAPVIDRLAGEHGRACRVISLCELRGLRSPRGAFAESGVRVEPVLPFRLRRAGAARPDVVGTGRARTALRALGWSLLLARPLARLLAEPGAAAVVPNDAAFPFDRILPRLRALETPVVLVQEGIRYDLRGPAVGGGADTQGTGGADAIAAWGESSADYFRRRGNPPERIFLTGNPRFDRLLATDWGEEAKRLARRLDLGAKNLLFLSNPIEDHGFCTAAGKLDLVARFLAGIEPLLAEPGFRLVLKLHGKESREDFAALAGGLANAHRVRVVTDEPLYPLLAAADGAVVFSSTAGLEALLLGTRLAVLEIPGHGFAHDYVEAEAAYGLTWSEPLAPQVSALLAPAGSGPTAVVEDYLERTVACRGRAAEAVAALVADVATGRKH